MELYINKKKVEMLQDPSAYLLERNKAMLKSAAGTGNMYEELMTDIVKEIAGTVIKTVMSIKLLLGNCGSNCLFET